MLKGKGRRIIRCGIISIIFFIAFGFFSIGMNEEIPPSEKDYINTVLVKITADSNKEDVIRLLGEPDRDLGLKVNWWVNINGNNNRIGVYFSSTTGKATGINFDGGRGRFYYTKDLK